MKAADTEATIGGMPEVRLEFHFDNWRRWMKRGDVTDGAPHKAAGCVGGGYSRTFDDMADSSDIRCAGIVDALVDSLSPAESAAIYSHYLHSVFRHGRGHEVFAEILAGARLKVAKGLVARGVY